MKSYRTNRSWASRKASARRSPIQFLVSFKDILTWDKATLFKNLFLLCAAGFLFGAILFLGVFAWASRDLPDPNSLSSRDIAQSTKIYDRTGEHLLYEISGDEKRTLVPIDRIPQYAIDATITAEDRKFYEHSGIDVKGILRAVLTNVATLDPTGQGASTITQQLVKNAILTNEKTYTRKMKEAILALALERRYTKEEILQLYLNEVAYGSTNYGIESASQAYYEKPVEELTLGEAATLASLLQAPTTYLNNPERLVERRDWILTSMEELGYITEEEMNAALAEDTSITLSVSGIDAPHFVLWVKEQLEATYGERLVEQGGLTVITSLDWEKQQMAEEAVANNLAARGETYGFNNSGLVAMDPRDGHILAMVGSTDYFNDEIDGQVNVTLRALQPGSSFKPIIYAAGFEEGYTPNTILWDVKTDFPTSSGTYSPNNYDLSQHGPMTVRSALQGSLNIPAVKMLYLIGVDKGLDFAERLHYSTLTDRSNFGLAIVLGGAEVELLDHVAAYGTFAAEGVYREPVAILRVESSEGEILEEQEENPSGEQVFDANVARMMSHVLSDNSARAYAFGSNSYIQLGARPVAAKTATTNDYKDAWTIGYTPSLVTGVWTGNTKGTAMHRGAGGSSVAAPIWNEFMRNALADTEIEYFTSPSIPSTGKAMIDGRVPSETVTIDKASGKLATDRTPERFKETVTCGEYHTILHYVDRSDPLGDAPKDPTKDPHYTSWESAVQTYIASKNASAGEDEAKLENCDVPTEEDDVHVPANEPSLEIRSPKKNAKVSRSFDVELRASAPRGIDRIEYAIDENTILIDTNRTGTTLSLPSWVDAGTHTLSVSAYDDVDNKKTESISIDVEEGGSVEKYKITNPFHNQEIERTGEAYTVVIEGGDTSATESITLSSTNLWTGSTEMLATISSPGTMEAVSWNLPESGDYQLNLRIRKTDGSTSDATPIRVKIVEPKEEDSLSFILESLFGSEDEEEE